MADACKVEEIEFHGEADPCCGNIPEQLMSVNGLALVATGSLSCVRALYKASVRVGKSSQFFRCGITKEEYAAGTYGPKILAAVNKALRCENTRYVVIYASCLEILAQMDFDRLISQAENPKNISIRLLKRGPLVKRYGNLKADVAEILSEIDPADEPIHQDDPDLPPLYPDFNGVAAILQDWDTHNFLTTAGGCGGALMDTGTSEKKYRMKHSRVNDVQIALGCDELIENGIRIDHEDDPRPLTCILGSTTLSFTGLDCESIADRLEQQGMPALYFPTDGFSSGPVGASQGYLLLGKKVLKAAARDTVRVNILGYSPMTFGCIDKIAHGIEHLKKVGLNASVWGEGGLEYASAASGAALNWVVSAEGVKIARYMESEYGVPYITGVPVGKCAMLSWRRRVNELLDIDEDVPEPEPVDVRAAQPRILIIGEPMLDQSIAACLHDDLGFTETILAVYAPDKNIRHLCRDAMGENCPILFYKTEEMKELADDADVIIADPTYREYISESNVLFVPLPYPLISGRKYLKVPYDLFGKKGGRYLEESLKSIF